MSKSLEFYVKNEKGEFELFAHEFAGWPANGIWLVEDGKYNCIRQIKDVPEMPTPSLISYLKFKSELEDVISKNWKSTPLSVSDISAIACEFFALKAGAIKIKDEIIEG